MESTGKYWVPVWNVLEGFVRVVIANPKWVSAIKGNKDDKKDSKWIGNLFRMRLVPESYIPGKDIRILRKILPAIGASWYPCVPAKSAISKTLSLCAT